tara:strand:+ start:2802 stop:3068 length:267 start_codon:yes stop_codon:yes gene_type:complete
MAKKKETWMPPYTPTQEQTKAANYCIRNSIRISPLGINGENGKWKLGINIGLYKKGEKTNIAPHVYDKHTIWPSYYEMCKYYYDKRTR